MLFRFGSERTRHNGKEKFETIETDKLLEETDDATSVISHPKPRETDREEDERHRRIMEEIFDDSISISEGL